MKLSELTVGASAVVREIPKTGVGFVRLRDMGLLDSRIRDLGELVMAMGVAEFHRSVRA